MPVRKTKVGRAENALPLLSTFTYGNSTNKPANLPLNSIYYETDTGNRFKYVLTNTWEYIDNIHKY